MNATSATTKNSTAKQVQVIARIEIKRNGHIVYKVRSSKGDDTYNTTLVEGHATGCTCPSTAGHCYHREQLEAIEAKRVVLKVGEVEVSGVDAAHAVEKALRVVKARRTVEDVVVVPGSDSEVSSECPKSPFYEDISPIAEGPEGFQFWLESLVTETDELPELPQIEAEVLDNEPLEEEFTDEVAEQWTKQEIEKIRKAAVAPVVVAASATPQAPKYANAPLNRSGKGYQGFSLMR